MKTCFYTWMTAAICLISSPAWGAESELSLHDVLHIVLNTHPDLPLARIEQRSLKFEQQNIEGMLDPNVSLATSLADETTPTTSPFAPSGTNSRLVTGNISKLLKDGSTLTGSYNYARSKLSYPSTVPLTFQASINPTYQQQLDIIYRYPLLRGHGNANYNERISSNQYNAKAAQWNVAIQQEQLISQAISLYYQIASNVIAKELAQTTVLRAKKLLIYQKKRQAFGLVEESDKRQAEALYRNRNMQLVNAQATLNQSITALNRLMSRDAKQPIKTNIHVATHLFKQEILQTWLQEAKQKRPIFHKLDALQASNDSLLTLSHDQHNTQVDIIGQVGTRSLSGSAGYTFGQGLTLHDRFISIGIEMKDTLGGKSTKAAIMKTELERERIQLQRQQALANIETELSNAITLLHNAKMLKTASKLNQQAEQAKFNSEVKRYRNGRSDTATLIQFESDLRTAELQASLQDIQIQLAERKIELATGKLLYDLAVLP